MVEVVIRVVVAVGVVMRSSLVLSLHLSEDGYRCGSVEGAK